MAAPKQNPKEVDDFGLPTRAYVPPDESPSEGGQEQSQADMTQQNDGQIEAATQPENQQSKQAEPEEVKAPDAAPAAQEKSTSTEPENDESASQLEVQSPKIDSGPPTPKPPHQNSNKLETGEVDDVPKTPTPSMKPRAEHLAETPRPDDATPTKPAAKDEDDDVDTELPKIGEFKAKRRPTLEGISGPTLAQVEATRNQAEAYKAQFNEGHKRTESMASTTASASEFSHQQLTAPKVDKDDDGDDGGWQTMPAYAPYDIYDDDDRLVAKEHNPDDDEAFEYAGLGGAGAGYTKVIDDEDAQSETSMDDNTRYLFKNTKSTSLTDLEEEQRDAVSQLQATKDLLTEGQRIAYVGVTRLEMFEMVKEVERVEKLRKSRKEVKVAADSMRMWSQKIMIRLYAHMDISPAEQIMIEQLMSHGVMPKDLTPALMQNARVKNPNAADHSDVDSRSEKGSTLSPKGGGTPRVSTPSFDPDDEPATPAPPPYETHTGEELPEARMPSQLPNTANIDIDLRWTVICDLFLVLVADSIYDARSRFLLERVAADLEVPWVDICRFEKRVTEALEMQQQAEKENWNEDEHVENRRKLGLKRRYAMMGLATVGGGLVIGLSAGLMAPVIGAGLAAGFTAIGVSGTGSFLAGVGGAAVITSSSAAAGSFMGGKAANRRLGSVKTFEYRPLHNNKRVNLIVTVSGWMTNKHDDIRLPFSTVDPSMGDLYSILWEPEMLQSIGDTINILATEAVTSTLQQILGAVGLAALMSGLQLPIVMAKITYLIDNPWAVSLDRAWYAGQILADSLIDRNLGTRPVTLVGYSLGARVIFSCLLELEKKGAYGLVQNVYMFGSPVVVKPEEYFKVRSVCSGRFVNGYNRTDWILGYLFRLTNGGIRRVAGLAPIEGIPSLENIDCTEFVAGHMQYRTAIPRLLRECGWLIESDEFDEIEDPDPDGHRERQREIINEIEEARKEMEKKGTKKSSWGFFGRKKTKRESWEVYEDSKGQSDKEGSSSRGEGQEAGSSHGVLFDSETHREEMEKVKADPAAAQMEKGDLPIKELKTTLPPMKLDVAGGSSPKAPALRETKSSDATATRGSGSGLNGFSGNHRGAGGGGYEPDDGGGMQMSFDTDYAAAEDSPSRPWRNTRAGGDQFSSPVSTPEKKRPDYKTTKTAPPNMWADDDDPDFGKEKEIEMTFA